MLVLIVLSLLKLGLLRFFTPLASHCKLFRPLQYYTVVLIAVEQHQYGILVSFILFFFTTPQLNLSGFS